MTNPAAFKATYSDWRLIKGRKVVQVVLELPLEAAGEAYDALGGMPRPDREVWCAVARLQGSDESPAANREAIQSSQPAPANPPPARAPSPYVTRIAVLCGKAKFWLYLENRFAGNEIDSAEDAAEMIRKYCGVRSRSEIYPDTSAGNRWLLLLSDYQAWDIAPRVGAA